jgi:uncharacterized membrane protein (GlpM family)
MQFLIKLSISVAIIVVCTQIGKKVPSLAGLIATMPLTGLIVLVWLYSENRGDHQIMVLYTRGALWGIVPSILFFLVALLCFSRQLSLPLVLVASFGAWIVGAAIHQWIFH